MFSVMQKRVFLSTQWKRMSELPSKHKIQNLNFLCFTLKHPFPTTPLSSLPIALRSIQLTFVRRPSGHCVGTLRAVIFCHPHQQHVMPLVKPTSTIYFSYSSPYSFFSLSFLVSSIHNSFQSDKDERSHYGL